MTSNTSKQKWVCYYRVSTQRQGESGLGLAAQRAAVAAHITSRKGKVIAEFTETESGKKISNRPQLQEALLVCRRHSATLIIAKLDRLARNVRFIAELLETSVDFIAADQPTKDRFMLHVQAAFAEEESRRISQRTKEALAAAKLRGVKIGAAGLVLAQRHKRLALDRAISLAPLIRHIQSAGYHRLRDLRDELNRRHVPAPGGAQWHLPMVHRTLQRIASSK